MPNMKPLQAASESLAWHKDRNEERSFISSVQTVYTIAFPSFTAGYVPGYVLS